MQNASDFEMLLKGYSLVTVRVTYRLPDFHSLINEFFFQTLDLRPRYPRVEEFVSFWRREIDAYLEDVSVADTRGLDHARFRKVDYILPFE